MNFNDEKEYIPGLKLLPFGGFEVAVLLHKLHGGERLNDRQDDSRDLQPMTDVSSGWLRSKMMAG
jgi:hypothetical protein